MKRKDFLWLISLSAIILLLAYLSTTGILKKLTDSNPYLMGFVKVSILATMGEILAIRISSGYYQKPTGLFYRFMVWGFLGMCFVIAFELFNSGVIAATEKHLLPKASGSPFFSKLSIAFFTSTFMNLIFAPTFMAFHRITDTYIDLGEGKLNKIFKVKLIDVTNKIDWNSFISFVVLKTIPFFWIPAHTITFMLPGEFRVLTAAFLSIALGTILAFAKRKGKQN
ncbi:membrane protein [Fervidicella metallireducens AeB]|uniref:Membrane protein n=1 Tax=Fervidicella metallireducens AeB TaxID=1403537 RepID=A0A017RVY4_9CLOT|nr:hypothetical protein [Fervidicella metallireducens]EYE88045.1 membrane protein [Fervidicella metallireducens AeB]